MPTRKVRGAASSGRRLWRFNGAASLPTRKGPRRARASTCRWARFNGAASLPTRKDRLLDHRRARRRASMGPRRCRRGRRPASAGAGARRAASMGPRRCRRGRIYVSGGVIFELQDALQWGRVVADAEGTRARNPAWTPQRSLQWGRVVADAEGLNPVMMAHSSPRASMGPRRCRRGRGRHTDSTSSRRALQWGRVVADAEGIAVHLPEIVTILAASMGPRRCRRGRFRRREASIAEGKALQWGRVVADAEGPESSSPPRRRGCFNGAASLPTRKGGVRNTSESFNNRFNGAASLPTRKA